MNTAFLILILTSVVHAEPKYVRRTCDEARFFPNPWIDIIQKENAIHEAFLVMSAHSGTRKVTNCLVEWPDENGNPVNGLRRTMFDMQWITTRIINGVPKKELHQEGIRIEYFWQNVGGVINRKVDGFLACRSPESCERMGLNKNFTQIQK